MKFHRLSISGNCSWNQLASESQRRGGTRWKIHNDWLFFCSFGIEAKPFSVSLESTESLNDHRSTSTRTDKMLTSRARKSGSSRWGSWAIGKRCSCTRRQSAPKNTVQICLRCSALPGKFSFLQLYMRYNYFSSSPSSNGRRIWYNRNSRYEIVFRFYRRTIRKWTTKAMSRLPPNRSETCVISFSAVVFSWNHCILTYIKVF